MGEEFKPITSQEELDNILKDRLNRANEKHARELAEKLEGFDSMRSKLEASEKEIGELKATIESANANYSELQSKYEEKEKALAEKETELARNVRATAKNNIAHEFGLPTELADRLEGNTEEELRADAENLKALVGQTKVPPLARGTTTTTTRDADLRAMSEALSALH